ncbi:MAG: hypothetical protein U0670_15220 [Anaerolineae bacterium]
MFDKNGRLSVFRVAVIGAIIGIVLVGGGILSLNNDQNSRRTPLVIDPYPGATLWGELVNDAPTSVRFYMRALGTAPDQVVSYYQQKLTEFAPGETCVRVPAVGELPVDPNIPNSVPYRYDCMFDRSSRNSTQYTHVSIFPEQPAMDPYRTDHNNTIITYQQVWQP